MASGERVLWCGGVGINVTKWTTPNWNLACLCSPSGVANPEFGRRYTFLFVGVCQMIISLEERKIVFKDIGSANTTEINTNNNHC